MTSTALAARNSGSQPNAAVSMMVRLLRSMTWQPHARAVSTRKRKCSLNSGAPPVRSTTAGRCARIHSATRWAVGKSIISVRHGAASTWQWRHVWLHLRPTLTWSACSGARRSARPWRESCWVKWVMARNEIQPWMKHGLNTESGKVKGCSFPCAGRVSSVAKNAGAHSTFTTIAVTSSCCSVPLQKSRTAR